MTEPIESVRHLEAAQTSLTLALETGTWTHRKRVIMIDIHRMIDDLIRNQKALEHP